MHYQVFAKYDDGYESSRDFDNETSAKNFFHNIDVNDTDYVVLNLHDGDTVTEVARKEPRKKATTTA